MNRPESPDDIEALVRRVFAPHAADVARVLARVSVGPAPQRRRPSHVAWAAVVLAIVAMGVVWRSRQPLPSRVEDSPFTITGDRELIVVERAADGRRWAVVPAPDGAQVGNFVIVLGK
jgi:hypothetical protein